MFDNPPPTDPEAPSAGSTGERPGREDERIALRCNRKELQLLDSFVANGEFESRSELMRAALREFLRVRAWSGAMVPGGTDTVEVSVRLRRDEFDALAAYGELVAGGSKVPSVVAELTRRGALELKVAELVAQARQSVRRSEESREQVAGLSRTSAELTRRGIIGR